MKIAKKVLSLFASSFAVLVFSGFLSLQPIGEPSALAHDTDSPTCEDISGVTQDVLSPDVPGRQGGISDSGHLDFDDTSGIDHAYQACAQRRPVLADELVVGSETVVRGWTWNSNLGYVSFFCEGGNNFGGGCGDITYQTRVLDNGRVRGWAWSDNTGWISMGCDGGMNSGFGCGNKNYGVGIMQVSDVSDPNFLERTDCRRVDGTIQPGDVYGYAWTNTVGWINFCGARLDLTSPLRPEIIIETSNPPAADADAAVTEGPVYANGSDFYKIVVRVKNGDTPLGLDELAAHGVQVRDFVWDNKLRADQVTRCSPADAPAIDETLPACGYNGNAALPSLLDTSNWEAAESGMVGYVRAIAPTGSSDYLSLTSFNVVIDGVSYEQALGRSFAFLPPVSVTRIYSPDALAAGAGGDSLFAQRNISTEHLVTAEFHPGSGPGALTDASAATVFTQLHDCSDAFSFVFDEGGVGVADPLGTRTDNADVGGEEDRGNIDRSNSVCPGRASGTLADIDQTGAGTPVSEFFPGGEATAVHRYIYAEVTPGQEMAAGRNIETDDALGIQARVQYLANGINVRYFSKKVSDSSLLNQAADIKGNVRIDVQSLGGLLGGRSEKSIGESAKSKSEFFNRAFDNLGWKGDAVAITSRTFDGAGLGTGVHFFKRDSAGLGGDTEPCKIIFSDIGDIDWSAKTTIASRGCDIYINSNILPVSGTAALGIVALEDFEMPKTAPRKGGNVYICATVTDVKNVHIVAENSVLPYGELDAEGNIACGDPDERIEQSGARAGLPNFNDPVREVLKNQLVITGSIVSNNTYGGAFKNPPEAGDGKRITDLSLMDTARFYDYNFFRYAHTVTAPPPTGVPAGTRCWDTEVILSKQLTPTGTVNPCIGNKASVRPGTARDVSEKGIMNIQFAPPPSDLPVFNYKAK